MALLHTALKLNLISVAEGALCFELFDMTFLIALTAGPLENAEKFSV